MSAQFIGNSDVSCKRMDWLNFHHLRYFWAVAREGSVSRAAKQLRLAQPTVSEQIHALEHALGEKLLERAGRGIALTEIGKTVYRFADEIFTLGRELQDTLRGRPTGRPSRLDVGLADAPIGPSHPRRAYNHLLGECQVAIFGTPGLARTAARRFPLSLAE